jgi:hypothetical protein
LGLDVAGKKKLRPPQVEAARLTPISSAGGRIGATAASPSSRHRRLPLAPPPSTRVAGPQPRRALATGHQLAPPPPTRRQSSIPSRAHTLLPPPSASPTKDAARSPTKMDGGGFDLWGSQASRSSSPASAAQAGLDLNTQVPAAEAFPDLGLYGAFLQSGDDELLLSGRVRGSGLPLHRPPCGRESDGCYDSWKK